MVIADSTSNRYYGGMVTRATMCFESSVLDINLSLSLFRLLGFIVGTLRWQHTSPPLPLSLSHQPLWSWLSVRGNLFVRLASHEDIRGFALDLMTPSPSSVTLPRWSSTLPQRTSFCLASHEDVRAFGVSPIQWQYTTLLPSPRSAWTLHQRISVCLANHEDVHSYGMLPLLGPEPTRWSL